MKLDQGIIDERMQIGREERRKAFQVDQEKNTPDTEVSGACFEKASQELRGKNAYALQFMFEKVPSTRYGNARCYSLNVTL